MRASLVLVLVCCFVQGLPFTQPHRACAEEEPARLSKSTETFFIDPAVLATISGQVAGTIAIGLEGSDGSAIRLIDLDRQQILKFGFQGYPSNSPAFSPSGEELAFSAKVDGAEKIFRSRWDGTGVQQVTPGGGNFGNPAWSTTGDALYFFSEVGPGRREIVRVTFSSSEAPAFEQLTRYGGRNTTPVKNPLAPEIAYSTDRYFPGWDICFFNLLSGKEVCPLGDELETFCRPDWSSDGSKLLLSKGYAASIDLYLYRRESDVLERITTLPYKEYDARFSPDGKFAAFSYDPQGDDHFELWLVRLSDKALFPLARSPQGSLRYLSWTGSKSYELVEEDLCPEDPLKMLPGVCGCGVTDQDSDGDGVSDCQDGCRLSPLKSSPGVCGCEQQDRLDASGAISCASPSPSLDLAIAAPKIAIRRTAADIFQVQIAVSEEGRAPKTFLVREKKRVREYRRRAATLNLQFRRGQRVRFGWITSQGQQSLWSSLVQIGGQR